MKSVMMHEDVTLQLNRMKDLMMNQLMRRKMYLVMRLLRGELTTLEGEERESKGLKKDVKN